MHATESRSRANVVERDPSKRRNEPHQRVVFLVEDNIADVFLIQRAIEFHKLSVQLIVVEDGEKALAVCRCRLPEAILLDWNMPVMDGYEFLGKLLDLPGGDKPRVVFCTTENKVEQRERALMAGACEYIAKPFDSDIVATKFRAAGLLTFTIFPGADAASFLDS